MDLVRLFCKKQSNFFIGFLSIFLSSFLNAQDDQLLQKLLKTAPEETFQLALTEGFAQTAILDFLTVRAFQGQSFEVYVLKERNKTTNLESFQNINYSTAFYVDDIELSAPLWVLECAGKRETSAPLGKSLQNIWQVAQEHGKNITETLEVKAGPGAKSKEDTPLKEVVKKMPKIKKLPSTPKWKLIKSS